MPVTARRAFPQALARHARALGFSLVEVLVSMFVVAMGILALAGLLQAATRHARMSELRSNAALLANDIADRMRANAMGAQLGALGYDNPEKAFPTTVAAPHAACTVDAPCSPADLAKADMAAWTARVRATLPKGSAWIQFRAGKAPAPDSLDVWVGWADPLTLAPGISTDRSGTECPPSWRVADPSVRCVYLQVTP